MAVRKNGHETLKAFCPYYDQLCLFPVYLTLEAQTPSLSIKKHHPILKFPLELGFFGYLFSSKDLREEITPPETL